MIEVIDSIIGPDSDQIKWWQMGLRGALVFVLAIFIVRYGDRRIFGKNSALDIILGIILGSILSRAITGNSPFYETIFTTGVLVGLHWILAFLSYRFKGFGDLVKGHEIELIRNGQMLQNNLRENNITEKDICEAGRKNNIQELEAIQTAFLERSGDISLKAREN